MKKHSRLDICQKRLWNRLKDHFDLWDKEGRLYSVRKKGPLLVLTEPNIPPPPNSGMGGSGNPPMGLISMSPEVLRNFFRFMNIDPPPGMFPEEGE